MSDFPCLGAAIQHSAWVFQPVPGPGWRDSSQLVGPSGPGSQTLPSHYHWGKKVPKTQPALRPPKLGPGPTHCDPWILPWSFDHRGGDRGDVPCCFKVRALDLYRTQPLACTLAPQLTHRPETGGPGEAGEKPQRSPRSTSLHFCCEDHWKTDQCWSTTSKHRANGHTLTVVPLPGPYYISFGIMCHTISLK